MLVCVCALKATTSSLKKQIVFSVCLCVCACCLCIPVIVHTCVILKSELKIDVRLCVVIQPPFVI